MKKRILCLSLVLLLLAGLTACNNTETAAEGKNLIVYFPNWGIFDTPEKSVENLPWDKVSIINHSFWEIVPSQEREDEYKDHETAALWKVNGDTPFAIRAIEKEADFGGELVVGDPSSQFEGHFAQYERMSKEYPDVTIMLSIGGWTRTGMFSDMASEPANRAVFIQSCIDLLKEYSWLGGIDLDWEFPAAGSLGGRPPESATEQGCPSRREDPMNYTALLEELRAALDEAFPKDHKMLTICAPASPWAITGGGQSSEGNSAYEMSKVYDIVDCINIMTYDFAGSWTGVEHHTNLKNGGVQEGYSIEASINFYASVLKVPMAKLNIGAATYSIGWELDLEQTEGGEAAFQALKQGDDLSHLRYRVVKGALPEADRLFWYQICENADQEGFIQWYDEAADATLLFINDPDSPYYGRAYTYDTVQSVRNKADFILTKDLGGVIFWDTKGDTMDENSLIAAMNEGLSQPTARITFDSSDDSATPNPDADPDAPPEGIDTSTQITGKPLKFPVVNPSRKGFSFDGWYTQKEGGELVAESAVVPETDTTYYAHWTAK